MTKNDEDRRMEYRGVRSNDWNKWSDRDIREKRISLEDRLFKDFDFIRTKERELRTTLNSYAELRRIEEERLDQDIRRHKARITDKTHLEFELRRAPTPRKEEVRKEDPEVVCVEKSQEPPKTEQKTEKKTQEGKKPESSVPVTTPVVEQKLPSIPKKPQHSETDLAELEEFKQWKKRKTEKKEKGKDKEKENKTARSSRKGRRQLEESSEDNAGTTESDEKDKED